MLSTAALANVRRLIPNGDMSAVATWADDVRHTAQWSWSAVIHYFHSTHHACGGVVLITFCWNNHHSHCTSSTRLMVYVNTANR